VVCLENFSTGEPKNIAHVMADSLLELIHADVSVAMDASGPIDAVTHLASPASPPGYLRQSLETLAAGSRRTENALRLALRHRARFVLASTNEVYGDPLRHPQDGVLAVPLDSTPFPAAEVGSPATADATL
jgi:dTDP-glucose 4,6-dehydratase